MKDKHSRLHLGHLVVPVVLAMTVLPDGASSFAGPWHWPGWRAATKRGRSSNAIVHDRHTFLLPLRLSSSLSQSDSSTTASTTNESAPTSASTRPDVSIDPKEAVKLFGRLAEKYIVLDESGGMCCYSGCSDCEFRLPGGGYRMADQSAARPKWIPSYTARKNANNNQVHETKWSTQLFVDSDGGEKRAGITKEVFVERIRGVEYAPPLGGPYVGASSAAVADDGAAARRLFEVLADGSDTLSRARMGARIKALAGGEEGMTWAAFQAALGV